MHVEFHALTLRTANRRTTSTFLPLLLSEDVYDEDVPTPPALELPSFHGSPRKTEPRTPISQHSPVSRDVGWQSIDCQMHRRGLDLRTGMEYVCATGGRSVTAVTGAAEGSGETMSANEFLDYLRARDASRALGQVLKDRSLNDTCAEDFGLTWRTRRLTTDPGGAGTGCRDSFAVALAVPKPPLGNPLPVRSEGMWRWIQAPERRYRPLDSRRFPPGDVRAAAGGIMVQRTIDEEAGQVSSYLYAEKSGVLELGVGADVFRNGDTDRGFLLTPLVGRVWQFLSFASDLFRQYSVTPCLTLTLALARTEGALLGGLAEGWRSPWNSIGHYRPRCILPNVLIRWSDLSCEMTEAQIEESVRGVAVEVEATWGYGSPSNPPRCFVHGHGERDGQFDARALASLVS